MCAGKGQLNPLMHVNTYTIAHLCEGGIYLKLLSILLLPLPYTTTTYFPNPGYQPHGHRPVCHRHPQYYPGAYPGYPPMRRYY
ncbi:unnamed protein product [Rotaria magnacalcarata]